MEGIAIVGKKIRVVSSPNPLYVGLEGTVSDETRNMVMVRCADGKTKGVPKSGSLFALQNVGGWESVPGDSLAGTSEARARKK